MITKRSMTDLAAEVEDGLTELIAAGRTHLANLEHQKDLLDREIAAQHRKLRTWETAHGSLLAPSTQQRLHLVATGSPPSKREAVLAFLGEAPNVELKLVEIRRALIGRGWMTDNPSSIHALEVAVVGMAERGEVHRVRKGYYRLRTDASAPDTGSREEPDAISSSAPVAG